MTVRTRSSKSVASPANENVDPAAPVARRERLGGILSSTTIALRRSLGAQAVLVHVADDRAP